MIRELLFQLYTGYRNIVGTGALIVLFIAAVLVIVLFFGKGREGIKYPVFLSIFGTIGIAFGGIISASSKDDKNRPFAKLAAGVFCALLCLLAIASSGKYVFSDELNSSVENDMHLPGGIAGAASVILSESDSPAVFVMSEWKPYFECYSSKYSFPVSVEDQQKLDRELEKADPDMRKVSSVARKYGCTYIVLPYDLWPQIPITRYGFKLQYESGGCRLYKEVESP